MTSKDNKAFMLWVLLQQTKDAVYNARNKELAEFNISSREAAILGAIFSIGETATPTKLARWVYRKPHTIAAILHRMQKKGLVVLTKDKKIKNLVRIRVTDEGTRVYQASHKTEAILRIFHVITDDSYSELQANLTKIRDEALKETGDSIHRPFPQ
jgi:DNA-binding MarR family transcriptional regulator